MNIEISIIIPAYNAEKTIGLTLHSIFAMRIKENFEVIVVDDGSTDKTKEIISGFKEVKLVSQDRKGPGAARNTAIKIAKGAYVYFLDSDCEVLSDTIEKLYIYMHKDEKIGAVGGSIELPPTEKNLLAIADHYVSWYHHNPRQKSGKVRSTPTANLLVKKEVFEKTGYFMTGVTSGEDVDFGMNVKKAGYEFHALNNAIVYHYNRTNLNSFLRHSMKWGYNGPLVRTNNKNAKYHYLFPENIFLALILFIPCFILHLGYIQYTWLKLGEYKSLLYFPFLMVSCFYYQIGVIIGTRDLKKNQSAKANIY
jgi:glycosyltransferase involved in cell wall biosynthesis